MEQLRWRRKRRPPAPGAQQPATGAAGPGAPGTPGQPAGRGGRGGLGGPQENDPANATADYAPKAPVTPVTPAEQQKRFWLPPGFKMEPVLTDPDIEESAQIAFDGNGRMFVLEIRGYMQDADATGELDPVGRISVHEDRDNDGKYEKHSVFVDKLVFPRFVTPFGANAVLTMESNADEVWKYTDTNNDGIADKKELFATGFGRLANVEHQQSGLFWAMDNWLYSTVNAFRARLDAERRSGAAGTDRREQRPVGRGAGQLRQGVVPGRRQRHARVLPAAGPLRQFQRPRSVRRGPRTSRGARRC